LFQVINDLIVGGTSHGEIICWSKIALTVVARFDLHMGSITSINLWCSRLLTCGRYGCYSLQHLFKLFSPHCL